MTTRTTPKPRERLTRDRVVDAAVHIMDTEGLEAVTMRRVSREVGVEAMSLYNHVHDKEDLLQGVRLRLFEGFTYPTLTVDDPFENGRRMARAWRDLLKAHPQMLELLAEDHGPPDSLEALRPMETALQVLLSMGVPQDEVMQVFHAFGGYIQGFVMMEHQMGFEGRGGKAALAALAGRIDASELPAVVAALPYMADCDTEQQFELGLTLMLDGMRARYGA